MVVRFADKVAVSVSIKDFNLDHLKKQTLRGFQIAVVEALILGSALALYLIAKKCSEEKQKKYRYERVTFFQVFLMQWPRRAVI